MTPRPPQASRPAPSPPAGQRPRSARAPIVAPIVALLGLLLVAGGSYWTVSVLGVLDPAAPTATDPLIVGGSPDASGLFPSGDLPTGEPTPHATIVITPPPERSATITGTILFTKDGDIYAATGRSEFTALTRKGIDSAPTWTQDGRHIVFVETRTKKVQAPYDGRLVTYTFSYPNIMSITAAGRDRTQIYESIYRSDGGWWHSWVLQPDVSPDGRTIAVVSDGKDGIGDVTLHTIPYRGGALRDLEVRSANGLGHNDPAYSPDGRLLAFTYDLRSGSVGQPKIGILNLKTDRLTLLRGGYANPSWSPDGRYLAAEKTDGNGRDIVILEPEKGTEIARLTRDGNSFAPVFSPNGDQVAFLHSKGLGVDLWVMTFDRSNGFTLIDKKPVTEDGGLDAESPPDWFIPEDQRVPLPTAAPAPSEAAERGAGESAAP